MHINNNSPFEQVTLKPIEDTYSYEASVFGLKLPDGKIIVNFNHNTRYSLLKAIAERLSAEIVNVHGTWTFEPTIEPVDNEDE